jgi:7-cyano-7-deazaguanine synthase
VCSITGGFVNQSQVNNPDARGRLVNVLDASADRGRDAFGLNYWDLAGMSLGSQRVRKSVTETKLKFPHEPFTFLGTMRGEPTTEWRGATTEADIQPFTVGAWTVCHNGTIANDAELRSECQATSIQPIPTEVDTWTVAYVLSRYGFQEGIKRLTGSFAFLAFNDEEPDRIYYATNYKPLYLLGHPEGDYYWFASQRAYFDEVVADPIHNPSPVQIEPYSHGWLTHHGELVGSILYPPHGEQQPRALIVCSGGLDSSVVAWMHHRMDFHTDLLHIAYECRAQDQEHKAVYDLAAALKEDGNPGGDVSVIETSFFAQFAQSSLTTIGAPIAQGVSGAEFAHEWVPARNTVMFALAVAFAEKHGYDVIAFGGNQEESCGGYPDNEQEFVNKWRELIPFAVKPYTQLQIGDPLGGSMKHEIVTVGASLNAPMELSWSCYEGKYVGPRFAEAHHSAMTNMDLYREGKIVHCGTCGPCTMRRRAFIMAGIEDKTVYAKGEL